MQDLVAGPLVDTLVVVSPAVRDLPRQLLTGHDLRRRSQVQSARRSRIHRDEAREVGGVLDCEQHGVGAALRLTDQEIRPGYVALLQPGVQV